MAELFVCKKLCQTTNGRYDIIKDDRHFQVILDEHMKPVVLAEETGSDLVPVCFPTREAVFAPPACAWCVFFRYFIVLSEDLNILVIAKISHNLSKRTYASSAAHIFVRRLSNVQSAAFCLSQRLNSRAHFNTSLSCHRTTSLTIMTGSVYTCFICLHIKYGVLTFRICYACRTTLDGQAFRCLKCEEHFCTHCNDLTHKSLQVCPSCG